MLQDNTTEWAPYFETSEQTYWMWHLHQEMGLPGSNLYQWNQDGTASMKWVGEEIHNGYLSNKFYHEEFLNGLYTGYSWRANSDTAWLFIDAEGNAIDYPFATSRDSLIYCIGSFRAKGIKGLQQLVRSLVYEEKPLLLEEVQKTLTYPLEIGKTWTVFERPWHRWRKVIGEEEVTVPAGSFTTLKLYSWDDGTGIQMWDWITGELWVKKVIELEVLVRDPEGRPLGTSVFREVLELTSYGEES